MVKATAVFDAGSLNTIDACNKPVEIEIKHPVSGLPTGMFVSVLGKDSDAYRARVRAMGDEVLRNQAMGKPKPETLDKLEAKNIDAIVAATVSWRSEGDDGHITLGGERLDCTPANARKLYTAVLPIRDQVVEAINDLGNFMPA